MQVLQIYNFHHCLHKKNLLISNIHSHSQSVSCNCGFSSSITVIHIYVCKCRLTCGFQKVIIFKKSSTNILNHKKSHKNLPTHVDLILKREQLSKSSQLSKIKVKQKISSDDLLIHRIPKIIASYSLFISDRKKTS